jgi:pyrroloquinoline quinone biosynthesis protein D
MAIDPSLRPKLPRGVRLHEDIARTRTVLLAPERVLAPNESALAVLKRCTGQATVREISYELSVIARADPAEVLRDVSALIAELEVSALVDLIP